MTALPKASRSDDWLTPPWLLHAVMDRFGLLKMDVSPSPYAQHVDGNGKPVFEARAVDGLTGGWARTVWCNPPYSDIGAWVSKAIEQIDAACSISALLLPVRTDTEWWSRVCFTASRVIYLRHRVRFVRPDTLTPGDSPTHGSCLVVFIRGMYGPPIHECIDYAPLERESWSLQRI